MKPKQNKTAAFHLSDSCISSFLVFLENTSFHIEKNTVENNCFANFIILPFGYDDEEANRCNRFHVPEVRNHEGKPYFRDNERKVWPFYEVNCHRKAPSKTSFSLHCFRLKYGSYLTG